MSDEQFPPAAPPDLRRPVSARSVVIVLIAVIASACVVCVAAAAGYAYFLDYKSR